MVEHMAGAGIASKRNIRCGAARRNSRTSSARTGGQGSRHRAFRGCTRASTSSLAMAFVSASSCLIRTRRYALPGRLRPCSTLDRRLRGSSRCGVVAVFYRRRSISISPHTRITTFSTAPSHRCGSAATITSTAKEEGWDREGAGDYHGVCRIADSAPVLASLKHLTPSVRPPRHAILLRIRLSL